MVMSFFKTLKQAWTDYRDSSNESKLMEVKTNLEIENNKKGSTDARIKDILTQAELIETKTKIIKIKGGKNNGNS